MFEKRLVKEPDLSLAYSILAYLSHVVSTFFVPCDNYDLESPVEMKYDDTEAESIVKTWEDIVHAKARETQTLSDTDMEERLERKVNFLGGRQLTRLQRK